MADKINYQTVNLTDKIQGLPDYVNVRGFRDEISPNQFFSLSKKYLQRDDDGFISETPGEAIYRMADAVANVEFNYDKNDKFVKELKKDFYDMISNAYFSPAGRPWTNIGTDIKGLFNCYVLPVEDDLSGIFNSVRDAAIIHKNGGGTGYNFSELRPRGTYVRKSKGVASGSVSFISQFDKETEVINSGNRRGANMGILDINHPDIFDFIYAKNKRGEITNFNVSVGIYDNFMKSLENGRFYDLEFPKGTPFHYSRLENIVRNIEENKLGGSEVGQEPKPASIKFDIEEGEQVNPGETKVIDNFSGELAGRVNHLGTVQLDSNYVFNKIAQLAWETADPGVVFIDNINKDNPLINTVGPMNATNPCGEQPLHPYDACNLGSIILSNMMDGKEINYNRLNDVSRKATRFMDNVNDANEGPIEKVEKTVIQNRRIGLGVMGWADMVAKMGIRYDSEESYALAEKVMQNITDQSKIMSIELAKEKGVFPAFEGSLYDNGNPNDMVRNLQRTTIAPTGTISMLYNVGSGIEPFFLVGYKKNIRGGDILEYVVPEFQKQALERGLDLEKILPIIEENHGSVQGVKEIPKDLQDAFRTAHDINYKDHILMQAAFQRGLENAVSKTINLPNDATKEDVKEAYKLAWENGIKGTTVYRDGSKQVQVLEAKNKQDKLIFKIPQGNMENAVNIPDVAPALKITQKTPFGKLHVFPVFDPSDYSRVLETFGSVGNAGADVAANVEGIGRLTSLWLRSGGKLEKIIQQLENIGSGNVALTREGNIGSLEMGFAQALKKYLMVNSNFDLNDLLSGKVDLYELSGEISDDIKKVGKGWKGYIENNGSGNNSSDSVKKKEKKKNKPKISQQNSDEDDEFKQFLECPECHQMTFKQEESCMKCINPECLYSAC